MFNVVDSAACSTVSNFIKHERMVTLLFCLSATSVHAGDIALQSLGIGHDDDDMTSLDDTCSMATSLSHSSTLDHVFLDDANVTSHVTCAEALWDHVTLDPEELAFRVSEVIEVKDRSDRDWWYGVVGDTTVGAGREGSATREGWFPAAFVRVSWRVCCLLFDVHRKSLHL